MATLIAVALFVFVLVAGNVIRETLEMLTSGRLTLGLFAYLMAILIPGVIPYALPLGLLFATLLVLGRMSAQAEVLALKAAGLSLWRTAAPILLLAMLGTGLALVISFYYAPVADTAYRQVLANIVRHDPIRFIQPRTFIRDFPGFVIFVDAREGDVLRGFYIWELGEQGKVNNFVKANTGSFAYAEAEDAIILTLEQGTGERRKSSDPENLQETIPVASFETLSLRLPLERILGSGEQQRKLNFMTLGELLHLRNNIPPDATEAEAFARKIEIQTAIQKKIAFSFSVLSLCIFAIPLGIKASRSETYANLGIALGLALTYFLLTIMISWTEKTPALRPDILLWIPNLIFQAFGLWLLARANKH